MFEKHLKATHKSSKKNVKESLVIKLAGKK